MGNILSKKAYQTSNETENYTYQTSSDTEKYVHQTDKEDGECEEPIKKRFERIQPHVPPLSRLADRCTIIIRTRNNRDILYHDIYHILKSNGIHIYAYTAPYKAHYALAHVRTEDVHRFLKRGCIGKWNNELLRVNLSWLQGIKYIIHKKNICSHTNTHIRLDKTKNLISIVDVSSEDLSNLVKRDKELRVRELNVSAINN